MPKWVVCWQQRRSALDAKWESHCLWYTSGADAEGAYTSLLPGPGGSFGPIEYRLVTLAQVLEYTHDA
jgi:hypothetical protein